MIATLIIILFATTLAVALVQRTARNNAEIRRHYLRTLIIGSPKSERYIEELTLLSPQRAKRSAARLLASLSPLIYHLDAEPLERISRTLRLSDYLLFEARRSRGSKCAYYLLLSAKIPFSGSSTDQLHNFASSKNHLVRFYALLSTINADPKTALQHIATYHSQMTQFEISQIIAALRQGTIVVAYQPMLNSENHNLNMLAMAIVRHFGIDNAAAELHKIIAQSNVHELRREALYTLASLQLPLNTPSINQFVRHCPTLERQRFIRFLAGEGYSQRAMEFFASHHEREQLQSLINSYKIKIGCFQH